MSIPATLRSLAALAGAVFIALVVAAPAAAHLEVKPAKVPADGDVRLSFTVGHGCEHSPTTSIAIQLPPQVSDATPLPKQGWKHQSGDGEVSWRGGSLDSHSQGDFRLRAQFDGEPGEKAAFKAIQGCSEGEQAWIEVPVEGEPEPEHPAPVVSLTAREHSDAAPEDSEANHADAEEVTTQAGGDDPADVAEHGEEGEKAEAAEESSADEEGSNSWTVVAFVLAAIALILAIALLIRRRS